MDIKRVLTGVIGFPVIAAILIFSNTYIFDGIVAIIALIAVHEFYNSFIVTKKAKPVTFLGYISCIGIALIHIIPKEYLPLIVTLLIPAIILILFAESIFSKMKTNIIDISVTLFGMAYVLVFFSFIALIRGLNNGNLLVWYIFMAAWGTDILAYLVGKYLGKHKFSEISPKKTIEGCIGGLIGAVLFVLIYTAFLNKVFNTNISYILMTSYAIIWSILGQIGDFAASTVKRYTGIKDYSNLLPGHGGMLDRFDSVIFIAPFAYILLMLI